MLRLLAFVLLVAIAALIVVKLVKGVTAPPPQARGNAKDPPEPDEAKLVRCTSCGAFVPRGEALPAPDGFRCGEPGCRPDA